MTITLEERSMRWARSLAFAMEDPVCAGLWTVVCASLAVLAG